MEELRSYYHILDNIDFELLDGSAESTIDKEEDAVYFTKEQLAAMLHFPVLSLIKQFLHFSGAPPALVHPNIIRILIGCSVLNLLYQLDISLVEVFFIYTLKLVHGGQLSLLAQSYRLQVVMGLPDSPKIEAKGVILARMKISDISVDISPIYPISVMFDTISVMTNISLIYRF